MSTSKHENYEILNLLGYGLSKFNQQFINEFDCSNKTQFYKKMVILGVAETQSVIKNRQDLFDPFFDNSRQGWWQKGDAYKHRKVYIDSLFGNENVESFANIVKAYLHEYFNSQELYVQPQPIVQSRFKQLQETGLEAEQFFSVNYTKTDLFRNGNLEDARLYGDGYDFQVNVGNAYYLAEVKGIRNNKGTFRLTENEYQKAIKYKNSYVLSIVLNLDGIPFLRLIQNPIEHLKFRKIKIKSKIHSEYHLIGTVC